MLVLLAEVSAVSGIPLTCSIDSAGIARALSPRRHELRLCCPYSGAYRWLLTCGMPVGPGPCLMPMFGVWGVKCGVLSRGWKFRASVETWAPDIPEVLPCVGLCPRLLV